MLPSRKESELEAVCKKLEALNKVNKTLQEFNKECKRNCQDGQAPTSSGLKGPAVNGVMSRMIDVIENIKTADKILNNKEINPNEATTQADTKTNEPRKSVLFWGLGSVLKENMKSEIVRIMRDLMEIDIVKEDIQFCYHYGKGIPDDQRPILIRFQSRYIYSLVWENKTKLNDTDYSLSLHLPMKARMLLSKSQHLFGNINCFVCEEYIIVKTPDEVTHCLKSHLELEPLIKHWSKEK